MNATHSLTDYKEIVGPGVVEEIQALGERMRGRSMQHINSTPVGGGVAEILVRLIPLLRDVGIDARWDVIKGDQAFYNVTKAFHNALHGKPEEILPEMFDIFRANTEMNLREIRLDADVIFIHDPQPAGLVARKAEIGRRWIWRCHIDLSSPQRDVWEFLRPYIQQYDAAIFQCPTSPAGYLCPSFAWRRPSIR